VSCRESPARIVSSEHSGPLDCSAMQPVVTHVLPPDATLVATTGCIAEQSSGPECSLETIRAGDSRQLTRTVRMGIHAAGTVQSLVAVASSTAEANPGAESASQDTTLIPASDDARPVLWGVDEDDGELFSIADYTKIGDGPAAAGFVSYGRLKYDQTGAGNLRDVGPHIEAFDLAADGTAFFGLSTPLHLQGLPDLSPPVILKLNVHEATPAGPNVVDIVGRVPIKYRKGDNISGLAVHPQTGQLYVLHRVGSSRHVDRVVTISPDDATIIGRPRKIQSKALGLRCDQCEDLNFDSAGRLFATDDYDDHLYELDPATGEILSQFVANESGGMTGVSVKIEALAWAEPTGQFIGFDDNSNQFVALTPGAGHNSTLGRLAGLTDVEGLDFLPGAPASVAAFVREESSVTTRLSPSVTQTIGGTSRPSVRAIDSYLVDHLGSDAIDTLDRALVASHRQQE